MTRHVLTYGGQVYVYRYWLSTTTNAQPGLLPARFNSTTAPMGTKP